MVAIRVLLWGHDEGDGLARSGADIAGVMSFHGGLDSPHPEDGRKIKCKVLALQGADDPFVPARGQAAFARTKCARPKWIGSW